MIKHTELEGGVPTVCRIVEKHRETRRSTTFVLERRLKAQPGQFVMVWLPDLDEKPFSLVDDDPVTLSVARVGEFTDAMHELGPGGRVWLRGPLGRGFSQPTGRTLLVGGGYGAAPLLFLARRAREAEQEVWVALGAARASDLLFVEEFQSLGCRVEVSTDDGSGGRQGLVSEVAEALLENGNVRNVAACGPGPLLDAVADLGRRWDVPTEVSREAYMRCGLGVCGSCAHEGRLVCKEGPVFSVYPEVYPVLAAPDSGPARDLPDLDVISLSPP